MAKQDEPVYDDDYGICYHKEKYDGEQVSAQKFQLA